MSPDRFLEHVIDPALHYLQNNIQGPKVTDDARRMLLAIALQESGPALNARYQSYPSTTPGPARGFWQFEQGGGVSGVLNHSASKAWAAKLCSELEVASHSAAVWRSLEGHDILSTGFARLLLWTDPKALPMESQQQAAWDYYIRNWRPGKPHPDKWPANWSTACSSVSRIASRTRTEV